MCLYDVNWDNFPFKFVPLPWVCFCAYTQQISLNVCRSGIILNTIDGEELKTDKRTHIHIQQSVTIFLKSEGFRSN